jgi:hypothetical protein
MKASHEMPEDRAVAGLRSDGKASHAQGFDISLDSTFGNAKFTGELGERPAKVAGKEVDKFPLASELVSAGHAHHLEG